MIWCFRALLCLSMASIAAADPPAGDDEVQRIAFGSCLHQDKPQPIWDTLLGSEPDVFLMLGDAVYADTTDPDELGVFFGELDRNPGWRRLREQCRVMLTWDDHDYGLNDGGAEHPNRAGAQAEFLDFAREPADSPRRRQAGVYTSAVLGPPGRRVQIILLDTRYHRSPLQRVKVGPHTTVLPSVDPESTLLGEVQWAWLEEQLAVEAELRLLVSSIQVINDTHPFEKWANFHHERERLYGMLRASGRTPVVILSGDQHLAEISRVEGVLDYPLYDFTSSGLNNARDWELFPNPRAVGKRYFENHFALIDITWQNKSPSLRLMAINEAGDAVIEHVIEAETFTPLKRVDEP